MSCQYCTCHFLTKVTSQDMAFQYGNQLASQGKEAVQRELGKYVPVSQLRYYFAVDTRYVIRKLLLIIFPYTHKVRFT